MAVIRILIDGYSLLHAWPDLAPDSPRFSMPARDALVAAVTRYRDAVGTPVSIIFDGAGAPPGTEKPRSSRELEVLFSKDGQSADDVIERVTHRLLAYGEVLVVSDDNGVRETVLALGGSTSGCQQFLVQMEQAESEMEEDVSRYRRRDSKPLNQPNF